MSELMKNKIDYFVVCVNDFADRHGMSYVAAFDYLKAHTRASRSFPNTTTSNIPIPLTRPLPTLPRSVRGMVDEFARRMQFRELYTQYSFHTERALAALRFEEVCDVA